MPKGSRRTTDRAAITREVDTARAELLKQMFETLSSYAIGCAKTVGELGTVNAEGKPGNLAAATKVLDFIAAHAGAQKDEALESLLSAVARIRNETPEDDTGTAPED